MSCTHKILGFARKLLARLPGYTQMSSLYFGRDWLVELELEGNMEFVPKREQQQEKRGM